MAKDEFKSKADFALALKLFEKFEHIHTIPSGVDLAKLAKIGKDHSLYEALHGKSFSASLDRAEVQDILAQRKLKRPARLAGGEIRGKKGHLLSEDQRQSAIMLFNRFPALSIIPMNKTVGEILKNILDAEEFARLDEEIKKIKFDKTVIQDNNRNLYAVSESVLGKGAFGEVCYAQVLAVGDKTAHLEVGQYTAMKRQTQTEDNVEDIHQEFAMEREQSNYHYGSLEGGGNIYSFIRLVSGGEIHNWVKGNILELEKKAGTVKDDGITANDFMRLFDYDNWLLKFEAEQAAIEDFTQIQKEIDILAAQAELFADFESRATEISISDPDEFMKLVAELESTGLVKFKITQDEDGDYTVEFNLSEQVEALESKIKGLKSKVYQGGSEDRKISYNELDSFNEQSLKLIKQFNSSYSAISGPCNKIKTGLEPQYGTGIVFDDVEVVQTKFSSDIVLHDEPPVTLAAKQNANQNIDIGRLMRVCEDLALKVSEAHAKGILHRDLKAENVLVDPATEKAVLIDWGIAIKLDADGKCETTTAGSPGHWPPEAFQKDIAVHTTAFDLYALGATYQDILKAVVRSYVDERHADQIMGHFAEMTTINRMRNIRIDNPDNDPKIKAINQLLQVIDDVKKVKPEDRADILHVMKQLKAARIELDSAIAVELPLRKNMHECLKDAKFSGNKVRDDWKVRDLIDAWNRKNPDNKIVFNERIASQVVVQVIQERAEKAKKAQQDILEKAQQQKQAEWLASYGQNKHESNLAEKEILAAQIIEITAIREKLSSESPDLSVIMQCYQALKEIGLLKVEMDTMNQLLMPSEDPTAFSADKLPAIQAQLEETAGALLFRKEVLARQAQREIDAFEGKELPETDEFEVESESASVVMDDLRSDSSESLDTMSDAVNSDDLVVATQGTDDERPDEIDPDKIEVVEIDLSFPPLTISVSSETVTTVVMPKVEQDPSPSVAVDKDALARAEAEKKQVIGLSGTRPKSIATDTILSVDTATTSVRDKKRPKSEADISTVSDQGRPQPLSFSMHSAALKTQEPEVQVVVRKRPKPTLKDDTVAQTNADSEVTINISAKPMAKARDTNETSTATDKPVGVRFNLPTTQLSPSNTIPKTDFPPAFIEKIYQIHPTDKWTISHQTPKNMEITSKVEPEKKCRMEMQNENIKFEATGKGVGEMLNCVEAYQQTVGKDFDLNYDLVARNESKAVEVLQKLIEKGVAREQITSINIGGQALGQDAANQLLDRIVQDVSERKGNSLR